MKQLVSFLLAILVSLLLIILPANPASAQDTLELDVDFSVPFENEINVPREEGRKGLQAHFCFYIDDPEPPPSTILGRSNCPIDFVYDFSSDGFPLDTSSATVTLRPASGGPTLTCSAGVTPAPGTCSFHVVDGDGDGVDNYVEILYNGDFDSITEVQYSVTNAQTTTGVTQDPSNPIPFTTGNIVPRPPVSVELVVDISGSMDWPTIPGGSVRRIDALKQAADGFFMAVNDYARLGDKLGAVYFQTTATAFDPTPGGTNLEPAHISTQVDAIAADLAAREPLNRTSIGAGLRVANNQGFDADPAPEPNVTERVLLFSDGEQNEHPKIDITGSDLQLTNPPETYPPDIEVCPITLGQQTAPGFILMQDIANAKCDTLNLHVSAGEETFIQTQLDSYFIQLFNRWFVGDKLEIGRDLTGTVAKNQIINLPFNANPNDVAFSFLISWQGEQPDQEEPLTFQLISPEGKTVRLTGFFQVASNQSFITLPMPLIQQGKFVRPEEGPWTLRLNGRRLRSSSVDYHIMFIEDNSTLESTFSAVVNDPGTNESIPIQVELKDGGQPILNANVIATVRKPTEGLGDILSTANVDNNTPNLPGDKPRTAAQAKLVNLLNDPKSLDLFKQDTIALNLYDNGKPASGDAVANDGIYSAIFNGADEEGHYNFTVEVEGETPLNKAFKRTSKLSVFVRSKPSPAKTILQATNTRISQNGIQTDLEIIPLDILGNKLGPGYEDLISIKLSAGKPVSNLIDNLDGSYTLQYELPRTVNNAQVVVGFAAAVDRPTVNFIETNLQKIGFKFPLK